jgi:wobble nucleotide-excising tRNase
MRDFGIFRDFTWPSDLAEFGRYNLIYGWNWSGKTTLSNLLRSLETRTNPAQGQATLHIEDHDTNSDQFAGVTLPVRVFNRDFISENVFTGQGDVAPIFVLGKQNIEKQRRAEVLKITLKEERTALQTLEDKARDADRALDSLCICTAKEIKDMLSATGPNRYNNYNKADFKQKAEELTGQQDHTQHRLDEIGRARLLQQHTASPKPRLTQVAYDFPPLNKLISDACNLLSQTVVSRVIDTLKKDTDLATWVRDGLRKHRQRAANICLFCGQTLPPGRIAELEDHFSDEYERFLGSLDTKRDEVKTLRQHADELLLPNKAELYDDLMDEYRTALAAFQEEADKAKAVLVRIEEALRAKKDQPFEDQCLDMTVPHLQIETLATVNAVIAKHNGACDEFARRVTLARQQLENATVVDAMPDFSRLVAEVGQANESAVMKGKTVQELEAEIIRLERDIVEHLEPAEELNKELCAYLGHDELRLQVKETGYQIVRQGRMADGLSEGERTAIALLYFLKSLKDRRFDLTTGLVVVDDPVSSLDSNAIFAAFGLIKERTKNAGQLFVLTHNFTFFRQVREWFHRLRGQTKKNVADRPARFYMLDCAVDAQGRFSTIRPLDPLLEAYESEYHYLFCRVYQVAMAEPSQNLEAYYSMPNMARRLLEGFLAFRVPDVTHNIWEQLQRIRYNDEARKARIYRFLHTYSHHDQIGEQDHDLSILSETRSILTDVLKLIQAEDSDHYSAMVTLVTACAETEE